MSEKSYTKKKLLRWQFYFFLVQLASPKNGNFELHQFLHARDTFFRFASCTNEFVI